MAARKTYILKLYVAGNTPNSMRALNTLKGILENEFKDLTKDVRFEANLSNSASSEYPGIFHLPSLYSSKGKFSMEIFFK